MENQRRARGNSRTGLLGVTADLRSGRFAANIKAAGRRHYIGSFATPEEAHAAYVAAKRQLHEFGTL